MDFEEAVLAFSPLSSFSQVLTTYFPNALPIFSPTLLPPHQFRRIHRSFIISLQKIESYTAESVEVQGHSIPVGRGYKDVLENL